MNIAILGADAANLGTVITLNKQTSMLKFMKAIQLLVRLDLVLYIDQLHHSYEIN